MTKRINLTSEPIQAADGSAEVHLTVSTNSNLKLYYCEGADRPDKNDFHTLLEHAMNIPKGWSIWIWNPNENTEVIVGISEKSSDKA